MIDSGRQKQAQEARAAENAFAAETGGSQVLAFTSSDTDLKKLDEVDQERSQHLLACANVRETSDRDASSPELFADVQQDARVAVEDRLQLRDAELHGLVVPLLRPQG